MIEKLFETLTIIGAAILLLLLEGCVGQCVKYETRCRGDVVQICNADEWWEDVVNCAVIDPGEWRCVEGDTDTQPDTGTEPLAECARVGDSDT